MDQYRDDIIQPLYQASELGSVTKQDVLQAERGQEPLTLAHMQTVETVIMEPAPDLASVLAKLELGLDDGAFDRFDNDAGLRVLIDDIRRIANVGGGHECKSAN
tara:strand:+ start:6473 stop:6784 length:312 start_codon:yes stop_codon:yes gene_type:complete